MSTSKIHPQNFDEVCGILAGQGLRAQENGNNTGMEFPHNLNPSSKIIIYKKTGTVQFQGKPELVLELQEIWTEYASHLELHQSVSKSSKTLVYYVPTDKVEELKIHIESLSSEYQIKNETTNPTAKYCKIITDGNSNKVRITQFAKHYVDRGSKLLFQGLESELWEEIADHIAKKLNVGFETEIAKVIVSVNNDDRELDVVAVVTTEEKLLAEQSIKDIMVGSYNFLSNYDKDLIESSEYLIQSGLEPKNYFSFISGTILAFEGYVKKILIAIGAFKQSDINKDWKFSEATLTGRPVSLKPYIEGLLSKTDISLRNRQIRIICKLIEAIYNHRNTSFHNTPVPSSIKKYNKLASAKNVHEELVRLMHNSYVLLEAEIK